MPKEELKKYGKDAIIQEGFPWEEELKTLEDFEHKILFNKKEGISCSLCGTISPFFQDGLLDDGITPCMILKCPNDKAEYYLFKVLKQEAIKEIKFFRKNRSSNPDYSKQELNGVEKYIMWKFNVREEDLK